jgi:hypothetical protein
MVDTIMNYEWGTRDQETIWPAKTTLLCMFSSESNNKKQ